MHPVRNIEAQCNHSEFMQSLPKAVGELPYEITGNKVIVYDDKKRIEIIVNSEPVKNIGSLTLPMEKIEFKFPDHTEEQADEFMDVYRKHSIRCGGG